MALHLIKLCVGCESIADLTGWIAENSTARRARKLPDEQVHVTRMMPKRIEEILDGGSLYWVIKGQISCRQAIIDLRDIPADATRIDKPGLMLAPGLVDLQVNGGGGVQWNHDLTPAGLTKIIAAHHAQGTTHLLPTLISDSVAHMEQAIACARDVRRVNDAVLGVHLEGPCLNPQRSGIHPKDHLQNILHDLLRFDLREVGVCLLTLAPELFTPDQLRALVAHGYILSAGHSTADAQTLTLARQAGLRGVTHLFNAMGGLSARNPGLSGAALDDDGLYFG
jgi:N-acetylglucosamine-6-phosphate deacetylase